MLKYQEFIIVLEDATSNGSVAGMGSVVTPSVASSPGQTIGIASGSGDIGVALFKPFTKTPANIINNFSNFTEKRRNKRKSKKS